MLNQIYDHYIIIENIEFFSTGVHVYRSGFLEHDIEINNFYGDKSIILLLISFQNQDFQQKHK